jgi:hypothetical protein
MQNDGRQQFMPDPRMTTYSTASSFYNRESGYSNYAPAPQAQTQPSGGYTASKTTPSIVFPSAEILLGSQGQNGGPGSTMDGPARKRRKPSLNDPIQTHLLLQTALGDSGQFEILSFEELEALKREAQSIRARISGLTKKLALETKVRDAAKSLVRLQSTPSSSATSSPKFSRTNSGLSKEPQDKAQAEYAEAVKRCEALAKELYSLEQKERAVQTRILQHTAGILQNTHHGFSKNTGQGLPFVPGGGRPDSPASLDGSNSRALTGEVSAYDALAYNLNDSSVYESMLDNLSAIGGGHKRQPSGRLSSETTTQQREMMMYLASGLEDLNKRVAALLAKTNARKAQQYDQFPEMVDEAVNITFAQRLDKLTQGLEDISLEQDTLKRDAEVKARGDGEQVAKLQTELQAIVAEKVALQKSFEDSMSAKSKGAGEQVSKLQAELQASVQENLALQKEFDRIEDSMNAQLGDINSELYSILSSGSVNATKAPVDAGPMDSLAHTKSQVASLRTLVQSSTTALNSKRQTDALLEGLWSFILGAEEDLRARKKKEREQLNQKRSQGAQIDSEDEVSPDEDDGLGEDFSMQAFNTKVQWLVSQSLYLKEKQSSLRRKVKAHRERADRSLESVAGSEGVKEQLVKAEGLYATAKEELRDLEGRTAQLQKSQDEKDARIKALQTEIAQAETDARNEAQAEIEVLEQQLQNAQQKASTLEKTLASTKQEHEAAALTRQQSDESSRKNEAELVDLRDEVIRLKTELTIAQAELEGAYGSRSQRAAEMTKAANTEAIKQLEVLTARNAELAAQVATFQSGSSDREAQLRKELADTLKDFEELTKASVDSEREREELEGAIDKYRDRVEGLEAQLAEDSVKWLGIVGGGGDGGSASPGSSVGGAAAQSMSVVVLKNEFKKMMREARVESSKQLRVSCVPSSCLTEPWKAEANELCRLSRTSADDWRG